MKILHVVALIQGSTGGPAVSVTRLASEQAKLGHEVTLACLDYPHLGPQVAAPGVRIVSVMGNILAVRGRGWSPRFRRVLMEEAAKADIVHNHGLWMWPNKYAREAAVSAGKPLVISPRGMIEEWSRNRSRLRKAMAWRLFEKRNLQSASMFHATAESERGNIRQTAYGVGHAEVPVVVAPNGVDLPDASRKAGREALETRFPELKARRWVAFMSRLHPKKGIDVLLRTWARQKKSDAILVIAGPDLIGYRKDVERMIEELDLRGSVVLTGELQGEGKGCLLANAEVFVLPSYSENFGIVVAEAMAWARPVIASTATPWKEIADAGAGWWVSAQEDDLARVLEEALRKSEDELDEMGARGRDLVAERYTWAAPAEKLVKAYKEVLATDQHG